MASSMTNDDEWRPAVAFAGSEAQPTGFRLLSDGASNLAYISREMSRTSTTTGAAAWEWAAAIARRLPGAAAGLEFRRDQSLDAHGCRSPFPRSGGDAAPQRSPGVRP
ncbi:MAG: hypothetical protein V3V08_05175 [Nannocystaceae bacterium]